MVNTEIRPTALFQRSQFFFGWGYLVMAVIPRVFRETFPYEPRADPS